MCCGRGGRAGGAKGVSRQEQRMPGSGQGAMVQSQCVVAHGESESSEHRGVSRWGLRNPQPFQKMMENMFVYLLCCTCDFGACDNL